MHLFRGRPGHRHQLMQGLVGRAGVSSGSLATCFVLVYLQTVDMQCTCIYFCTVCGGKLSNGTRDFAELWLHAVVTHRHHVVWSRDVSDGTSS